MPVAVRFSLPDGRWVELGPEAIIGRMRSAALSLSDPAISEAHALVSLRGTQLKLLALRGRFTVDGEPEIETTLRPGQRIAFAPNVVLGVEEVSLPAEVLAARTGDLPPQVLPPVAAVTAAGELVAGFVPDAEALLWIEGEVVHARRSGHADEVLVAGAALDVAGHTFVIERMTLRQAGVSSTVGRGDSVPMSMFLRYDSVRVHAGGAVVPIDGIPARIVCELAELGGPVEWRVAAREIWPGEIDDVALRRNWDAGLARLRRALLEHGLRADLVRSAGRGRVELFLRRDDVVHDEQ